jgi:spermidine synthase
LEFSLKGRLVAKQEWTMNMEAVCRRIGLRRWVLATTALVAFCLCCTLVWVGSGNGGDLDYLGPIEYRVKSEYSSVRVRKSGSVRTLSFVRDNGDEVIESMVNLDKPHQLLVSYTRFMFLSYLIRPKQEKVLIVGLGGGAMVHFLQHYDPKVKVDVVEIDPVIVKIADTYFGVRTAGNVNIITKDAFALLKKTDAQYDVIYMDAFLKPSAATDTTGAPLAQKTVQFYKEVQEKLTPDGLVVFNINPHEGINRDVKNIQAAFPQVYAFELPNLGGMVVVGSMSPNRLSQAMLLKAGAEIDRRFDVTYSHKAMVHWLQR